MKEAILKGDRRTLAKALTLIESRLPEHQEQATELLESLLPHTGNSYRVGISGPPGVGKSTFIENFGMYLISQRQVKIAVLAVDPSSPLTGGSLLADKTRMEKLSSSEQAFIRPTPSSGTLGGVAFKTRESIRLCEAAGFDYVFVETVGVGQSEVEVADMVDIYLTLMLPNAGDEIQGIKKGLVELSDVIIVNKCDGDNEPAAQQAADHFQNALAILQQSRNWQVPVLTCSSREQKNFAQILQTLDQFASQQKTSTKWSQRREQQNIKWLQRLVNQHFQNYLEQKLSKQWKKAQEQVRTNQITPLKAAESILKKLKI